jgi:hypothetical protein
MSKKHRKKRKKAAHWLVEHEQKENGQIKEWRHKGTPGWARMD